MIELLKTLKDTPLPSILVIGGIIFLLLSFVRKVGSNIELEPAKTWLVGLIGIILLCSGVALYLIPSIQTPLAIAPTETPIIVEATTQSIQPTNIIQPSIIPPTMQIQSTSIATSPNIQPLREHKSTTIVGTGVLEQGTYSDGMSPISETEISSHLNIQRIWLPGNPDGCAIAFMDADKIWFGSSVKTDLTINDVVAGTINSPTGKHGYIFNATIHSGDKICVPYFEPSGFNVIFGPDIYYHYDSYCYRGNC